MNGCVEVHRNFLAGVEAVRCSVYQSDESTPSRPLPLIGPALYPVSHGPETQTSPADSESVIDGRHPLRMALPPEVLKEILIYL